MRSKIYLFLFIAMAFLPSCVSGDDDPPPGKRAKPIPAGPVQQYNYAVFLENSGSLNGYLDASGDEDFKSNVYDLIATLSNLPTRKKLSLYHINTKTDTVLDNADAAQISQYLETMTVAALKKRNQRTGGSQMQSNLSDIIKTVIDRTKSDDVSLLISDCIFSPGKQQHAQAYLNQQESSIKVLFGERLRDHSFATLILQFYSDFKGAYYYQDNSSKAGLYKERPYYIVCFGEEPALHNLLQYASRAGGKGFRNYLFLTPVKAYPVSPVIRNNNDYYDYDAEHQMTITQPRKGGRDHKFRIKISVDYAKLPLSESYLQQPSNYNTGPGYAVESVKASHFNKSTHEIILVATAPKPGQVSLALKRQLPDWINTSNLSDDRGLSADSLAGKTFGIRYLLSGMYNAYAGYLQTSEYFKISISVKD